MSAELAHLVAQLADDGLQVNLWPCEAGYQANVKERAARGWTCVTDADPVAALLGALRQRVARVPDRAVVKLAQPKQIDLEEAIAAAGQGAVGDELEGLGL